MTHLKNAAIIILAFLLIILFGSFLNWVMSIAFNAEFTKIQNSIVWILHFTLGIFTTVLILIDENK